MKQHLTRWTCNRCGTVEELEYAKQPWGWVSLFRTPLDVPDSADRILQAHVCESCKDQFDEFLNNRR